ncbi:hypothetical protein EVAR_57673_1 [Eumeta japonica]|uniref:Uncharacterized protein n=1 Tax=Eumeta variegata TaxID=151549 RepID=A0A4C1YQ13_EUMVA|nr:hypothetical protein EVAR_57673_1 [Eumeta japonica]
MASTNPSRGAGGGQKLPHAERWTPRRPRNRIGPIYCLAAFSAEQTAKGSGTMRVTATRNVAAIVTASNSLPPRNCYYCFAQQRYCYAVDENYDRRGELSKSRRSPPPMDTRNSTRVMSALPTFWEGKGKLIEGDWIGSKGKGDQDTGTLIRWTKSNKRSCSHFYAQAKCDRVWLYLSKRFSNKDRK